MKRHFANFICILVTLLLASSCSNAIVSEDPDLLNTKYSMIAEIKDIGEKIEVLVLESDIAFGTYLLITGEDTVYLNRNSQRIQRSDLSYGDKIKVYYSGQVMLSLPPQIVAHKITVQ